MTSGRYLAIERAANAAGLRVRGAFHPRRDDAVPAFADRRACRTLVLLGNVGSSLWEAFSRAGYLGREAHPLDAWSRAAVGRIAAEFGAEPLFPFGGPPFHPFLRWAQRAEPIAPSRMGPLIHPEHGLWHAYRGALALGERIGLPPPGAAPRPCDACEDSPCLHTCPVDALHEGRYDVPVCVEYLARHPQSDCMTAGCRARRACPVGTSSTYLPAQAAHHMRSFLRGSTRDAVE